LEILEEAYQYIFAAFPLLRLNERNSEGFISFSIINNQHEYDYILRFDAEEGTGTFMILLFHEGGSHKTVDVDSDKTGYKHKAIFAKAQDAGAEMKLLHNKYLQEFPA